MEKNNVFTMNVAFTLNGVKFVTLNNIRKVQKLHTFLINYQIK